MGRSILGVVEEAGEWAWEHRTQIAEVSAASACVFNPAACIIVSTVAFGIDTVSNVEHDCGSFDSFAGSEGLTIGETILGGAPGFLQLGWEIKFGETAAGKSLLPASSIGRWLLNAPPAMAADAMGDLEPGIKSSFGPGGASEGGSGGGEAGPPPPGGGGGPGGASGSAAASSGGESCG